MNGAMLTPSTDRIASTTQVSSTIDTTDFSTDPMVRARCERLWLITALLAPDGARSRRWRRSSGIEPSPGRRRVTRSMSRLHTKRATNATITYPTILIGFSISHSRFVSVHSKAVVYVAMNPTVRIRCESIRIVS